MAAALDILLQDWRERLRAWSADGSLASAARHALELGAENPLLLNELLSQWTEGDFSNLPPIVLLAASSMPGAAGAYAISTGAIYLNEDWLESASDERITAVLTEELGHHLDGLLNAADSPGDEGELFAALLLEPAGLSSSQQQALRQQRDHGSLQLLSSLSALPLAVELAAPTAIRLSQSAINEGELPGGFVAFLATVDADAAETFAYAMVDGDGDEHNAWFEIQGNRLVNSRVVDREQLASVRVRLRSTDSSNQSVEQVFELPVNNLQDPLVLPGLETISFTRSGGSFSVDLSDLFSDPFSSGRIARFHLDPVLAATIQEVYWDAYPQLRERSWLDVVLFDQELQGAPLTAANLERYVESGLYSDTFLHRLVPNFVLQGGGFVWSGDEQATSNSLAEVPTFAAVPNEFSEQRSNIRGTMAMAKLGNDPNSATSQWFFNLADNSANLDQQNGGFTVFGRLRDNTDLLLLDALGSLETLDAGGVFSDLPLYKLGESLDPTDVLRFSDVEMLDEPPLQFGVTLPAGSPVEAQLENSAVLRVDAITGLSATASPQTTELTLSATNLLGETVQRRLDVITNLTNRLTGNSAKNVLDGGGETDVMVGGKGNDTYIVDHAKDVVREGKGAGIDTVRASVSHILKANVENLVLIGNKAINGTGNNLKNRLTGNGANNILNGRGGMDVMNGRKGNDTYVVDHAKDVVREGKGAGIDTVRASVSHTLKANIDNLLLIGNKAINGTGNNLKNRLTGNSANNILNGRGSNDRIIGRGGNDSLIGSIGKDTITGGSGADVFIYRSDRDSEVGGAKRDVITDFRGATGDRIDLSAIDAFNQLAGKQEFTYIGSDPFSGKQGEVRFESGILQANTGSDTNADMEIFLRGVTSLDLSHLIL